MSDNIKLFHRPPQYAVGLDLYERLLPTAAFTYRNPFGLRINISCVDMRTNQLYNFDFSEHQVGAKVWYERCEN